MKKLDISKENLYIKEIINVWRSSIKNYVGKPIFVDGRHSDALVYIISGSCTYTFDDGNSFTVKTGDILYLAKKAVYRMDLNVQNHQYIYTDFEFDSDELRKSDYYTPSSASAENLFTRLLSSHKTSFTDCISTLYSIYGIILSQKKESKEGNDMVRSADYIKSNFKDLSLSVETLAEIQGISEVYFRRLFKKQYGIPPSQYIITTRIEHAKSLIKHSFLSLEECAVQSGFSSVQYFCRVFKKVTGMTPTEYRKAK